MSAQKLFCASTEVIVFIVAIIASLFLLQGNIPEKRKARAIYRIKSSKLRPDCRTIDRKVPKGISFPCFGTITVWMTPFITCRYFACDHFWDTKTNPWRKRTSKMCFVSIGLGMVEVKLSHSCMADWEGNIWIFVGELYCFSEHRKCMIVCISERCHIKLETLSDELVSFLVYECIKGFFHTLIISPKNEKQGGGLRLVCYYYPFDTGAREWSIFCLMIWLR